MPGAPRRKPGANVASTAKVAAMTVVAGTKVVLLTPERGLERAARRFLPERTSTCVKCGSAFIDHEPAFMHCRYCGAMVRLANRPLAAQEEFELRSGLRVAS